MWRSSRGERCPEVAWKGARQKPLKEPLLFGMGSGKTALPQRTSKKGCASKSGVSNGKLGNLKEISTV